MVKAHADWQSKLKLLLCVFKLNSNDTAPMTNVMHRVIHIACTLHFGYNIRRSSHYLCCCARSIEEAQSLPIKLNVLLSCTSVLTEREGKRPATGKRDDGRLFTQVHNHCLTCLLVYTIAGGQRSSSMTTAAHAHPS